MTERRTMDPVDRLLLRQESDPRRRSTITVVLELDRVPAMDDLAARLTDTVRREARLRQRVVRPWRDLGAPEWVIEDDVDVRGHLGRGTIAAPGTTSEVIDFVEGIADDDIDPDRPLWRITLLDGGADGGGALVVRMSHVLTDGLAGMQLLAGLVDVDESANPESTRAPVVSTPEPRPLTSLRLAAEHVLGAPARAQDRYRRQSAGTLRALSNLLADPRERFGQATRYVQSLIRLTAPKTPPTTFAERSADRRLIHVEVRADLLRRAGRRAGGSLNDAYLAGVIGGLRRYHERHGARPDEVPFAIPVSTRHRNDDSDAGNRFAAVRFSAPIGVVDPAERIRQLGAIVRTTRAEPALDAMTALAPALVELPDGVLALAGLVQDRLDMQASYVSGPPIPVHLAGARVTSMTAFGPLPGPAAMSVMITYAGVARIGLTVDAVAVPDVEVLREAMVEGFAEVVALAGTSRPTAS